MHMASLKLELDQSMHGHGAPGYSEGYSDAGDRWHV